MKIIICIDGLGKDLFSEENCPFLYNLSKKNFSSELETFFAFTGIEYGFFARETTKESGIWMEFSKSEKSIFNNFLLRILSFNPKLRDYFAVLIQLIYRRTWLSGLHNIPSDKLKDFDTTLERNIWELNFFKNKSFAFYKWPFFVYSRNGKITKRIIFKNENDEEKLKRLLQKGNFDIYYVQLLGVDKVIHKFGKKSFEAKEAIKKMDKILERNLYEKIKGNDFILWGDHGFADIKNVIDIEKILPQKQGYTYFVGGTTVSFWFKNKEIEKEIREILSGVKELKILDKKMADKFKIPLDKRYGELIYFLYKGNYFFPNFYQKKMNEKFLAMHGYPNDNELNGILISNKINKKKLRIDEVLNGL